METSRKHTYTYRITATHGNSDLGCVGEVDATQIATYAHVIVDRITEFTQKYNIPVFGCKEHIGTPNEHFHFFLDTDEDEKNLRDNIHNKFPEWRVKKTQKKLRALKRYDYNPPSAYKYLCKGDKPEEPPCIVINTVGLTQDEILMYQRRYWGEEHNKSSSKSGDTLFLEWFVRERLDTYKHKDISGDVYFFENQAKIIDDITTYYDKLQSGFKMPVIHHKLHLIYNTIVRKYDRETFDRYRFWMHKEVSQVFNF